VACSQVQTVWQLYLVFVGLGIAMAMALYEPATPTIAALACCSASRSGAASSGAMASTPASPRVARR
jgi:hypothetical protein